MKMIMMIMIMTMMMTMIMMMMMTIVIMMITSLVNGYDDETKKIKTIKRS